MFGKHAQPPPTRKHVTPYAITDDYKRLVYHDMFKRIMNSPCQNHGFVMTHLAKDCIAYHQRVTLEAQRRTKQDRYSGDRDDDHDIDAAARSSMLIFGGPQVYLDRWLQKLTHRWIYVTAPAGPLYIRWSKRSITYDRTDHPDRVVEVGRFL